MISFTCCSRHIKEHPEPSASLFPRPYVYLVQLAGSDKELEAWNTWCPSLPGECGAPSSSIGTAVTSLASTTAERTPNVHRVFPGVHKGTYGSRPTEPPACLACRMLS